MRRWSTSEVAPSDRFDYWNGVICEAVLNVAAQHPSARNFRGEISARQRGTSHFVRFVSDPHEIERSARLVRSRPDESYLVSFQIAGTCDVEQAGNRFVLNPGDLGVVSAARPMLLRFDGPIERMVAVIPRSTAEACGPWFSPDAASRVAASPTTRVLARLMTELSDVETDLTPQEEQALTQSFYSLLGSTPRHVASQTTTHASLPAHLVARLLQELSDPTLSPATLAAAIGVSERTLHAQFARAGTTCMRWIMQQRLARAAQALQSPAWYSLTISEIAYRQGFTDMAHFSRRFRQAYGYSPKACRQMSRGG